MRTRLLLPALCALAVAGCDDVLTTSPVTKVRDDEAITDARSAAAAVAGAYDALQDDEYYGGDGQFLIDLAGDDVLHSGTFPSYADVDTHNVIADNGAISGLWDAIYVAVGRANALIQKLPEVADLSAEARDEFLGEAYFLRALAFHDLVRLWGDVPMPTTPSESPAQAAQISRTPADQVYTQILADLEEAEKLMGSGTDTRRATLGAVEALRSRVLLYTQDWQGVVDAANAVEAMGYSLAPSYPELFDADGADTPEDIFRIRFTPVEYCLHGYYYLSFDAGGRAEIAPTSALDAAFEADDERHAWTIALDSDGFFYSAKWPTAIGAEDVHVLRFAEVILNKAEALARMGSEPQLEEAVAQYNRIRERAGLDPHSFGDTPLVDEVGDQQEVLDAIWQERRVEFALEGHRFADLVRTGRAVTVLGIEQYETLWPIPQEELDVAPNLTQNDGY